MLKLKSRIALIILLTLIFTNTHVFASEIKEAEAASFASGPSLNTLVDNMSESDGVSYIYYNLGGAANNINNCGYITPKQKFMGLREPHKYGYKFDGWYLDADLKEKADPTLSLTEDQTVYAKWKGTLVGYKAVYLTENADDDNYSYAGTVDLRAISGTTVQADDGTKKPQGFDTCLLYTSDAADE